MNKLLAYLFYHLGDFSWALVRLTDHTEITRKLIMGPCWSLYKKFMDLSLNYDEKAGWVVWKKFNNE